MPLVIPPIVWALINASFQAWMKKMELDLLEKDEAELALMKAQLETETAELDARLAAH